MLSEIRNPIFFLVASIFVGAVMSENIEEDASRVKRGAAVYITFPAGGHGPSAPFNKSPQDFINTVGANNQYSASSGYGGALLAQYNQHGGGGGSPGGSSGGYGRRKRSPNNYNFHQNNFPQNNFEYNPYHTFDPPSWNSPQNLETSYSAPISDYDNNETPYSLNLPNPVSVDGLLQAATNSNVAQAAVFRAYTARTPYFGLNASIEPEESTNKTFNSEI